MEFPEKCPNCGHQKTEGDLFCGNCGRPYDEKKPEESTPPEEKQSSEPIQPVFPAQQETVNDDERKYVAWEDRENLGFFEALWLTWKESMFNPEAFYSKLPYRGGYLAPLLYAIIIGWLGIVLAQIVDYSLSNLTLGLMTNYLDYSGMMIDYSNIPAYRAMFYMIMGPVIVGLLVFIFTGIFHLLLTIFGWTHRDFEATFRAVAYGVGPILLLFVPVCGCFIFFVWISIAVIIGLKHMQKTTGGKAALVYFIPLLLCCCLVAIIFSIMGAALMEMFGNNSGLSY